MKDSDDLEHIGSLQDAASFDSCQDSNFSETDTTPSVNNDSIFDSLVLENKNPINPKSADVENTLDSEPVETPSANNENLSGNDDTPFRKTRFVNLKSPSKSCSEESNDLSLSTKSVYSKSSNISTIFDSLKLENINPINLKSDVENTLDSKPVKMPSANDENLSGNDNTPFRKTHFLNLKSILECKSPSKSCSVESNDLSLPTKSVYSKFRNISTNNFNMNPVKIKKQKTPSSNVYLCKRKGGTNQFGQINAGVHHKIRKPKKKAEFTHAQLLQTALEIKEICKRNESKEDTPVDDAAGEKKFGVTECGECKFVCRLEDPADELMHFNYHNARHVFHFNGWKDQHVVSQLSDAKIIRVLPTDPKPWLKKVRDLLEVVNRDLGVCDMPTALENTQVYLYVKNKTIVGCLFAESKTTAFRLLSQNSGTDLCSEESYPIKCGVARLWVLKMYHQQGIDSSLLESLRCNFMSGSVLVKADIAFSSPTELERVFATNYFGSPNFLIYTC